MNFFTILLLKVMVQLQVELNLDRGLRSLIGHWRHRLRLGLASQLGIFSRKRPRRSPQDSLAREGVSCLRVVSPPPPTSSPSSSQQRHTRYGVAASGFKRHFAVITTPFDHRDDESECGQREQWVVVGFRSCDQCLWPVGGMEKVFGPAAARDN